MRSELRLGTVLPTLHSAFVRSRSPENDRQSLGEAFDLFCEFRLIVEVQMPAIGWESPVPHIGDAPPGGRLDVDHQIDASAVDRINQSATEDDLAARPVGARLSWRKTEGSQRGIEGRRNSNDLSRGGRRWPKRVHALQLHTLSAPNRAHHCRPERGAVPAFPTMDEGQRDAIKDAHTRAHAEAVAAVYAAIVREAGRTEGDEGARNVLTSAKAIRQFAPAGWFAYAPNRRLRGAD